MGLQEYLNMQIWTEKYKRISKSADTCFNYALDLKKQGEREKSIFFFAAAWGFYRNIENVDSIYLVTRHLRLLGFYGQELQALKNDGFKQARDMIDLGDKINKMLTKRITALKLPELKIK